MLLQDAEPRPQIKPMASTNASKPSRTLTKVLAVLAILEAAYIGMLLSDNAANLNMIRGCENRLGEARAYCPGLNLLRPASGRNQ